MPSRNNPASEDARGNPLAFVGFHSSVDARHSRNIAARPQVSIVIFDSQVPIGTGQGVYLAAVAEELSGTVLDRVIEIYLRRSQAYEAAEWTADDVRIPAVHRLHRATVSDHWMLDLNPGRRGGSSYSGGDADACYFIT